MWVHIVGLSVFVYRTDDAYKCYLALFANINNVVSIVFVKNLNKLLKSVHNKVAYAVCIYKSCIDYLKQSLLKKNKQSKKQTNM